VDGTQATSVAIGPREQDLAKPELSMTVDRERDGQSGKTRPACGLIDQAINQ
jgi:hypothetical protein